MSFTRQFVFLKPDYFVVFDRVESTKPDLKKTWVLHTKSEPLVQGDLVTVDAEELGYNCPVYQWYTSRAFSKPEYENESADWERVPGSAYKTKVFRDVIRTKVPNRPCRLKMLIPADGAQLAFLCNLGPEYGKVNWSVDGGKWKGTLDQRSEKDNFPHVAFWWNRCRRANMN